MNQRLTFTFFSFEIFNGILINHRVDKPIPIPVVDFVFLKIQMVDKCTLNPKIYLFVECTTQTILPRFLIFLLWIFFFFFWAVQENSCKDLKSFMQSDYGRSFKEVACVFLIIVLMSWITILIILNNEPALYPFIAMII